MPAVVVVATIRPKRDQRAEVIAALEKTIAAVHEGDAGCLLYALHKGEDRLVMVEKWASVAALAEHSRGPALAELNQALDGRLDGELDVQILQPHPAAPRSREPCSGPGAPGGPAAEPAGAAALGQGYQAPAWCRT